MKKKRITYGVPGMMEFQTEVSLGNSRMRITFSDGFVSSRGEHPAIFTTDNFMVQQAIERSHDYQRGRIKKVKTIELAEELPILRNGTHGGEASPATNPLRLGDTPGDKQMGAHEGDEPQDGEPRGEDTVEDTGGEPKGEAETVKVEVTCNEDARDYMESNFGVLKSKMRNWADITALGLQHGVEFVKQ